MAPFGKIHWFARLIGFVVLIAFGYLNVRYVSNFVTIGWPRVCYLVRDNTIRWELAEFYLSSLMFDVVLLLSATVGVVVTTNRWLMHARLPLLTVSLNLAVISAIATYFTMFQGWDVGYAAQELAITIVFAAILVSWIGLFNWLGEKLRIGPGDSGP